MPKDSLYISPSALILRSPGDSWVPANHEPTITFEAPAASARATSRGWRTPPSAHTWAPSSRAAAAHSRTAENCGRPTPVCMRVVHMAPGPTPTLMMSAPAATRSRTPSAVTTLPATTGTPGSSARTRSRARIIESWWPWAVSTTRVSAPASSSARARPSTSPLMPSAAPTRRRPSASTAGRYSVARRAPRRVRMPASLPSSSTTGASLRLAATRRSKASSGSTDDGRVSRVPLINVPTWAKLSAPRRSFSVISPMGTSPSTTTAAPWARLGRRLRA